MLDEILERNQIRKFKERVGVNDVDVLILAGKLMAENLSLQIGVSLQIGDRDLTFDSYLKIAAGQLIKDSASPERC